MSTANRVNSKPVIDCKTAQVETVLILALEFSLNVCVRQPYVAGRLYILQE